MPKPLKTYYVCNDCGHKSLKWVGRCPYCGNFNTMNEETERPSSSNFKTQKAESLKTPSFSIANINDNEPEKRIPTGIGELDRVLSGGFVEGSFTLVGGEPGVGKSTLILQLCQQVAAQGKKILYASGEESVRQIKMRANRLNVNSDNIFLLSETSLDSIIANAAEIKPFLLVIDSIQTVIKADISSAPGSITQVRECAAELMRLAKLENICVIIIGHVTKEGNIAGPRMLEHMVDTVLYFEGERHAGYRLIRAVKNRFGTTNEIGMFEMRDEGLKEIGNPSEYMLAGRPIGVSGSVVTCTVEGTRPILTEAQALVNFTTFGNPRRMSAGVDLNRVIMIIAALEKRGGLKLAEQDIYINIAGGIKITEPAADAAIAAAVISSYKNKVIDPHTMIFGETGLTGEVRAVTMTEKRVMEGAKLGFKTCIIPESGLKGLKRPDNIKIYGIRNLPELINLL